ADDPGAALRRLPHPSHGAVKVAVRVRRAGHLNEPHDKLSFHPAEPTQVVRVCQAAGSHGRPREGFKPDSIIKIQGRLGYNLPARSKRAMKYFAAFLSMRDPEKSQSLRAQHLAYLA